MRCLVLGRPAAASARCAMNLSWSLFCTGDLRAFRVPVPTGNVATFSSPSSPGISHNPPAAYVVPLAKKELSQLAH